MKEHQNLFRDLQEDFRKMKKNLLVAQSGGPTAAINATLAGVIKQAIKEEQIDQVYGACYGIQGVLEQKFVNLTEKVDTEEKLEKLKRTPAAALGSCRFKLNDIKEDDSQYQEIVDILHKMNIGYFVYIGGNDSMDTVAKLSAYCKEKGERLFAYEYNGYWKDVGTLSSYWEANMELIDIIPVFNLYEEFWRIYTKSDTLPPQYIADTAKIERSIISEGCDIYGEVYNSVIGAGVTIEEGAVVRDSIIMKNSVIKKDAKINKAIIAEEVVIDENTEIGVGEEAPSKLSKKIYASDIATIGEQTYIPKNVKVGKNTVIMGKTKPEDYPDGLLESGDYIIKAGEM